MYLEFLPEDTKNVLFLFGKEMFIKDFYLAGGTGLALQIGHRISGDLDFFAPKQFDENLLIQKLSALGKFQLEKKSEQSVIGILNDVKISFLGYKYPLLSSFKIAENINIADVSDVACMKIDAIAGRGTKRDFIDVYFIVSALISLSETLKMFEKKYAKINYNMIHVRKSLVYFDDAEEEPMPQMLKPVDWHKVKEFFQKEIKIL